jgi:hypothetical protein
MSDRGKPRISSVTIADPLGRDSNPGGVLITIMRRLFLSSQWCQHTKWRRLSLSVSRPVLPNRTHLFPDQFSVKVRSVLSSWLELRPVNFLTRPPASNFQLPHTTGRAACHRAVQMLCSHCATSKLTFSMYVSFPWHTQYVRFPSSCISEAVWGYPFKHTSIKLKDLLGSVTSIAGEVERGASCSGQRRGSFWHESRWVPEAIWTWWRRSESLLQSGIGPGRSARSQLFLRLIYPGPFLGEVAHLTKWFPSEKLSCLRKVTISLDVVPYSLVEVCRRFSGVSCLHHQGGE